MKVNILYPDLRILYFCPVRQSLQKITAPFLALLVLLSTVSWTVDKHLCMGRVMDVAFFQSANSCGMAEAMEIMGDTTSKMDCCDDESFTIEGQDDLKLSWEQLSIEAQVFVVSFLQSNFQVYLFPGKNTIPEQVHPPPLLDNDLNLLYEVFLIWFNAFKWIPVFAGMTKKK